METMHWVLAVVGLLIGGGIGAGIYFGAIKPGQDEEAMKKHETPSIHWAIAAPIILVSMIVCAVLCAFLPAISSSDAVGSVNWGAMFV